MRAPEGLYPDDNDGQGRTTVSLGGMELVVKVGNIRISDLSQLREIPRDATHGVRGLLAGVAVDPKGEIVDYVLVSPQVGTRDDSVEIDWGARLATARQLFEAQNSSQ